MFFSRFSLSDLVSFFLDLVSGRRSRAEFETSEMRRKDCSPYLDFSRPLRILDLANGALRPQSIILANEGHQVVGVDLVNNPKWSINKGLYYIARQLFLLFLPRHRKTIGQPPLVCARVEQLPFADESFDLITSVAAFEHFLELERTLEDCHRVLKPGGLAWISIHVFSTLSGGHNFGMKLGSLQTAPSRYEPWDHLRKKRLPITVPLNQWRIAQYLEAFRRNFKIVRNERLGSEGVALLTPRIRKELTSFTEEELTCGSYLIVARKSHPHDSAKNLDKGQVDDIY